MGPMNLRTIILLREESFSGKAGYLVACSQFAVVQLKVTTRNMFGKS